MIRGYIKDGAVHIDESVDWPEGAEVSVELAESNQQHPAINLINRWLQDDSGYDEASWPELQKELDQHRLSTRKLFDA